MATPLELLKFNLQEKQYPYFDDVDLITLLESNDNNLLKASWKGCLLKANADDGVSLSSLKVDSNRDYWLNLAKQYEIEYKSSLEYKNSGYSGYKNFMRRADGQ
ncbi:hypothetical protein HF846_04045 [Clostridium cadaveris]|uniref:hypothetical protein n=1 Tax=Clostridium cadaveris TaxID=1529 RepID=UPI001459CEEA|nr:hypothetical protein [Clostridium cadaveris]MDM8310833.1 hypothetical protein [Clostridium cadaveris]NME63773.1 hypothetical protein [Clostridium cadaveris]